MNTETAPTEAELRDRLRSAGLRSTAPRVGVLRVLARGGHWSAAEVFEEVKGELPGTSMQAIYGVLSALDASRLARRIEPTAGAALYEMHQHDNHHHLICIECGDLQDVPCAVGAAPCLTASDDHGYEVVAADVTFRGVCPSCKARLDSPAGE